jgi:hypothetical protein
MTIRNLVTIVDQNFSKGAVLSLKINAPARTARQPHQPDLE